MVSEFYLTMGLFLIPLALGALAWVPGRSLAGLHILAITGLVVDMAALAHLGSTYEYDPIKIHLGGAILLAGLCAVLGQGKYIKTATVLGTTLVIVGLSLGALLAPTPTNRVFLIGLFGFSALNLIRSEYSTTQKTVSLVHWGLAVLCILISFVLGKTQNMWIGLFLALTLLPLIPFHAPFLSTIGSSEGLHSCVWVVVLISLGLSEIAALQHSAFFTSGVVIPWWALASALYASLKCLGESRFRHFLAYAAVAHLALLWASQHVFLNFSTWGIEFGMAIAFVMSGLFGVYAFLQQRYGSHELGKIPGLAVSMPRLGILMILLITLAMLLPILPIVDGVMAMPTLEQSDVPLLTMLLTFLGVWLFGSWYFSNLLHQTAFGMPHLNLPHADLRTTEMGTLLLLIVGASFSGFLL